VNQLVDPVYRRMLAWSPQYWFMAELNQLNGLLPAELDWLARRAWIGQGAVLAGAGAALALCYLRTMKKTVEEPDLVPGAAGFHWHLALGDSLRTAIVSFSMRSLLRSRQHRVVLAFYWSLSLAIALSCLRDEMSGSSPGAVPARFLISSFMVTTLAVFGLRNVSALPISLNANWMLRVTQLRPVGKYFAGTRALFFFLGVLPALLVTLVLGWRLRPWEAVAAHLVVLLLAGCLLVEIALFNFEKVPFTCSYLPGKANVQVVFWGAVFIVSLLSVTAALFERGQLLNPWHDAEMFGTLAIAVGVLRMINWHRSLTAQLYFEEVTPEIITTLGLSDGMRYAPISEARPPAQDLREAESED
jgi:hypothetical protein